MFKANKFQLLLAQTRLTYGNRKLSVNYAIEKILIANRGEIACRIIRTAKKLGIKTVAVYSKVDKNSMHVELADEAYYLGPSPSSQSYLRQDKIIATAKNAKCQAIHPGYGFLSENTEFAELCEKQNIIFIGPPSKAIRDMGIKSTSKAIMSKAGIPIIEGYHGDDQSNETLLKEAQKIGYPLMIKAVRGGGGKGMRIVWKEIEFLQALESARTESDKAFGDSSILLEQYVSEPRHIEVQIFADTQGNIVHLFERDCSIQRRHQKVIEEAPAPGISKELRLELGKTAVQAAKAVGYVGAGTVEFIMNKYTQKFYFMEMNTRLQVEHPVTEAITKTDLVEWQLRIAAGEELPLKQENIQLIGHAFEARIYAENPRRGFLPGAGKLLYLSSPSICENIRIETGVQQNDEVSVHYDPMIAKLIVWGKDRNEALNKMRSKLSEYNIVGLETNIEFIKDICLHPQFRNGKIHTGFIAENYESLFPKIEVPNQIVLEGALGIVLHEEMDSLENAFIKDNPFNPFVIETGLRINHSLSRRLYFQIEKEKFAVDVQYHKPDVYYMKINDHGPCQTVIGTLIKQNNTKVLKSDINGVVRKSSIVKIENKLYLFTHDRKWKLNIPQSKYIEELDKTYNINNTAISPMPGIVDKILVNKGDIVKAGDPLLVVVAMKMEYIIKATSNGIIEDILCDVGENIVKNKLLVKMKDNTL